MKHKIHEWRVHTWYAGTDEISGALYRSARWFYCIHCLAITNQLQTEGMKGRYEEEPE